MTVTTNAWNTGLTASVTITNTGTTTINGWGAPAPGVSVTIGYQAGHTGNSPALPVFTLNGTGCTSS
ncbi:hypothetical protein GCM10010276_10600 [Streptomyces longisporus]|uniref:CBM2 domain-containing protein n=1 Tax=Streptomyces longisporus TaxID=1948 RepID=A0ABP5YC02_STRLO